MSLNLLVLNIFLSKNCKINFCKEKIPIWSGCFKKWSNKHGYVYVLPTFVNRFYRGGLEKTLTNY